MNHNSFTDPLNLINNLETTQNVSNVQKTNNTQPGELIIVQWNCRSLWDKYREL